MSAPEQITEQERWDQLLAHHEVAHFKACLAGDIPVDFIQVERNRWFSTERTSAYNRLGGSMKRYEANDPTLFVRMCMAGQAAEEYWLELHPGHGEFRQYHSEGDRGIVRMWISRHPELDLTLAGALADARRFVRANWTWITAAAPVVLERDRATRGQVVRAGRKAS